MATRNRPLSKQALSVLAALRDAGASPLYGLVLSAATGLKSGSLYPLLIRLDERGLVEGEWQAPERPGRPPRHAYRITGTGRQALIDSAGTTDIHFQAARTRGI